MSSRHRVALWFRLAVTALFLLGVVAQFLTAGYGWFVGGFDVHETLGWTLMHFLPVMILLATLVLWSRLNLALALVVGVLGVVQPFLAQIGDWVAVLHPLNALVTFFVGHLLLRRDVEAVRARALPPAADSA